MKIDMEKIRALARKADPEMEEGGVMHNATSILISCMFMKHDDRYISNTLGIEYEFTKNVLKNLRRNGIIKDGKVYANGWKDRENGKVNFLSDVLCGLGKMKRVQPKADKEAIV